MLEIVGSSSDVGYIIGFAPLVVAVALQNSMACIVFRQLKFGIISRDGVSDVPHSSIRFTEPIVQTGASPISGNNVDVELGDVSTADEPSAKVNSFDDDKARIEMENV